MKYIKFIIESNSNRKLDAFTKVIIKAIISSGAGKAGPIPYKGKRIIYCYNPTSKTINRLMSIKVIKGLDITIEPLVKS